MKHLSVSALRFSASALVLASSLSACVNQSSTPTKRELGGSSEQVGSDTKIVWPKGTSTNDDHAKMSGYGPYPSQYCFQNNVGTLACTRPDGSGDVAQAVGTSPVMIQGFQPMLSVSHYSSINITRASVTMALFSMNTATGKASFTNKHVRSVYGDGNNCKPDGSTNAAGIAADLNSAVTGLYLYEDGVPAGGLWSSVVDTATKVFYSGIIPVVGSGADIFKFDYTPAAAAESRSFGVQSYSDAGKELALGNNAIADADQVARLKFFGLDQSYVDSVGDRATFYDASGNDLWSQFVMVGFCIEGTKTVKASSTQNANQSYPIFFRVESYRQVPHMEKVTTTTSGT